MRERFQSRVAARSNLERSFIPSAIRACSLAILAAGGSLACGRGAPASAQRAADSRSGSSSATAGSPSNPSSTIARSHSDSSATFPSDTLRLERVDVHDDGLGCTALTLCIPAGWKIEGGIQWQLPYANLATVKMRILNAAGVRALEIFPVIPCAWDTHGIGAYPPGSNYLGYLVTVPPRDAETFVLGHVLPKFRAGSKVLRVADSAQLLEVERAIRADGANSGGAHGASENGAENGDGENETRAGRVRLEYAEDEQLTEEDFYCAFTIAHSKDLPRSRVLWMPDRLFSFRAPHGKLDHEAPLFGAMVASMRIDASWYDGYLAALELARKNGLQAIRDVSEISRRIPAESDEERAARRTAWEREDAAAQRVMESFCRSIGGLETCEDPFTGRVLFLPSGYREIWASAKGEYWLTKDASARPNGEAGADEQAGAEWRRVEKRL
jgi:hypothetical protein